MNRFDQETRDEWWIEFMEGEVSPSLERDLKFLLCHSQEDRQRLNEYKELRSEIEASDDSYLPENGYYYQNQHDSIMAAIENIEMDEPRAPIHERPFISKFKKFRPLFGTGFTALAFVIVGVFALKSIELQKSEDQGLIEFKELVQNEAEQKILLAAQESHRSIGFESETDMLRELAAQKFGQLSDAQAKALMNQLLE